MKICPKCRAENASDDAQFCNKCGAPLAIEESGIRESGTDKDKSDDLDFVVTETSGPAAPDFLGELNGDQKDRASETTERIDEVDLRPDATSDIDGSPRGPKTPEGADDP